MTQRIFNVSRRKVGGIWFVKLGRVNISFCVSRPKSILEVQRMHATRYRDAANLAAVERALTAALAMDGRVMEVNYDR